MKNCISCYVNALIDTWTKAFRDAHVKDRRTITEKVKQVINHYKTHVYNDKNRTKPKKKGNCVPEKDHSNTQSGVEANVHESDKKS